MALIFWPLFEKSNTLKEMKQLFVIRKGLAFAQLGWTGPGNRNIVEFRAFCWLHFLQGSRISTAMVRWRIFTLCELINSGLEGKLRWVYSYAAPSTERSVPAVEMEIAHYQYEWVCGSVCMTVCVRVSSQTQARGDKVVGIEEFCVCVYLCVSFHFRPFFFACCDWWMRVWTLCVSKRLFTVCKSATSKLLKAAAQFQRLWE